MRRKEFDPLSAFFLSKSRVYDISSPAEKTATNSLTMSDQLQKLTNLSSAEAPRESWEGRSTLSKMSVGSNDV